MGMRTAIVHYWLLNMRGGEKVVEALCRLFPAADLFTLFYDPERVSPEIRAHRVTASFLNPLRKGYRSLLPLMPYALEHFDLRDYDLIISSESGPAKGIVAPSAARHVCYCHTPMRYLWDLYPAYRQEWARPVWRRTLMTPLAHYLRLWDYSTAARVDAFMANSENVRRRIWKTYRREAEVVYPPVAVRSFYFEPPQDYFLAVAEFVPYKRLDVAVRVFSANGRALRIVGDGPEYRRLRRIAAKNIEFCGRVSDVDLRGLYARCRALLVPGEEDFGMNMVEALASGKPVIAFARGGALEIVAESEPRCGVLYDSPDDHGLAEAVSKFDLLEREFDYRKLQLAASRFSEEEFAATATRVIWQTASDDRGLSMPRRVRDLRAS
jgi:glycosyltransferase involved in cell wall biosynthesis